MSEKLIEIIASLTIPKFYMVIDSIKRDEISLIDESVFKDSLLNHVIADSRDTQSSIKRQIIALESDKDEALEKVKVAIRASARTNFEIAKRSATQALTEGNVIDNT